MDDDRYVPGDAVGFVAIVGQWQGPRVATATLPAHELRPMGQVAFGPETLADFEANQLDHHTCPADEIALCPQFGQLHAGPSADAMPGGHECRQLLVYRGAAVRRR